MAGLKPRKRFGQNFLHDSAIIAAIVAAINPEPGQHLLEIGPGRGALTQELLQKLDQLEVIEIDRDLAAYLSKKFSGFPQLIIHVQDVLKFDFTALSAQHQSLFVVGNLPYNISTELLFYLSTIPQINNMVFLLQKEVVDRISARPGSTNYSRLSVGLQHKYSCRQILDVPKECFYPIPKVESAVIQLCRRSAILPVDERLFHQVVAAAFNQRRKYLRNSLAHLLDFTGSDQAAPYAMRRPQELSVEDFVNLTNLVALGREIS